MNKNYMDFIPCHNVSWFISDNATVTLEIKNKGILKKITQILFKKAKISYVHLDELGSFIWKIIDGKRCVFDISQSVKGEFGDSAEPLYERLIKFLDILKSYNFIVWKL